MKYKYILRIVNEFYLEDKLHEVQHYGYEVVSITPHVRNGTSMFAIIAKKAADAPAEASRPTRQLQATTKL